MLDEFKRFVEENILLYSIAINSWLKGEPLKHVEWMRNARYISEDSESRVAQEVHSFLGEKNEIKKWLVACLLKTIRDNQRWHKRNELIDGFPEATSYFEEML